MRRLALAAVVALLFLDTARTYAERYGPRRAWDMALAPAALCAAASVFLALRRRALALLALLAMQHVYYGGWWLFPQFALHGRASWVPCRARGALARDVAVTSFTSGQRERVDSITAEMAALGLDFRLARQDPALAALATPYAPSCFTARGVILASANSSRPWQLLLEDDARPHLDFAHQVECLLASESDLVWLDARTPIALHLTGAFECCLAGILYRTAAAARIAHLLCDGAYHASFRARTGRADWGIDVVLADACNAGVLQCEARALVSEKGFRSISDPLKN